MTKLTGKGGPGRGQGRHPSEIKRTVIKAYPTPEQKEQLEKLADTAGMSMSEYLIKCGLTGIMIDVAE